MMTFGLQEKILRDAAGLQSRLKTSVNADSFLTLGEKREKDGGRTAAFPVIPKTHPRYANVSDALQMKYEVGIIPNEASRFDVHIGGEKGVMEKQMQ